MLEVKGLLILTLDRIDVGMNPDTDQANRERISNASSNITDFWHLE